MSSASASCPTAGRSGVVITGAGLVSSLGLNRQETWSAVLGGRCGIGPLTALESMLEDKRDGGQVPEIEHSPSVSEVGREVRFLRSAVQQACHEARIDELLPYERDRCSIIFGTTLHGMRHGGVFLRTGSYAALGRFRANDTLHEALSWLGFQGTAVTTCSACSSGLASVGLGMSLLLSGEADLVIAGGYDPISEYAYGGFNSMRLVSPNHAAPFTLSRDGMKLAEGYAAVVLERGEDARRRGATVLARVLAVGGACDAFHLSKPDPTGAGAAAAIRSALETAGISTDQIGMIAAHATATPNNDAAEYAAMKLALGDSLSNIPVVAFKSHLGHTLGGAGVVELILTAMALGAGQVPPCANVSASDVEFEGLDVCTEQPRHNSSLRYAITTSLGFGGANACAVLEKGEGSKEQGEARGPGSTEFPTVVQRHRTDTRAQSAESEVVITGVGVVLPGAVGNDAFVSRLEGENPYDPALHARSMLEGEMDHMIHARRTRRMSTYSKLTLAATSAALDHAGIADPQSFCAECSAILGTAHGPADYCESYYRQIVSEGLGSANPLLFAEGVPNAAVAHLSTTFGIKGFCQTIIGSRTSGLDALRFAFERIRSGRWKRAIVSAAEETTPLVEETYQHLGFGKCRGRRGRGGHIDASIVELGSGSVALILESGASANQRGAPVRGQMMGAAAVGGTGFVGGIRFAVNGVARLLAQLGDSTSVFSSAGGTWIDRVEMAGIRRFCQPSWDSSPITVSSALGYTAELFSVTPLLGVAGALLVGALPRSLDPCGSSWGLIKPASGEDRTSDFSVICSNLTGSCSGVRVRCSAEIHED